MVRKSAQLDYPPKPDYTPLAGFADYLEKNQTKREGSAPSHLVSLAFHPRYTGLDAQLFQGPGQCWQDHDCKKVQR